MDSKWTRYLPKKNQWWIVLLVGVLLIIVATPTKRDTETTEHLYVSTDIEERLEELLGNMKNVGRVRTMITTKSNGDIEGIVVLAEGAGNAVVIRNITEVVQALFHVDAHKIKVIESDFVSREGK